MEKYSQYWDGNSDSWTIAESEHYIIKGSYEEADIYRKSDNAYITCVGHFYGDPVAGIIDKEERFCVTAGCGVIIYRLYPPYEIYMYDRETSQWSEFGRGPNNIKWIDAVRQIGPDEVELKDADGNLNVIHVSQYIHMEKTE